MKITGEATKIASDKTTTMNKLHELLRANGIKHYQLGDAIGKTSATIHSYCKEINPGTPKKETMIEIAFFIDSKNGNEIYYELIDYYFKIDNHES